MKRTNYYLFDFLDFNTDMDGSETLWRACRPVGIKSENKDIIVTIPFQKQKCSNEFAADTTAKRKNYNLRIRAYGDKILRLSIGFGTPEMQDSPMLELSPELKITPLIFAKTENEWLITDSNGHKKASFNFRENQTDPWSDLLPGPDETLDASYFPDGDKEIKISAYDQFSPPRHDAQALAFVEKNGVNDRATISFHADPDENFAGTGERFSRMNLSGKTFQLDNQDGQGVNNRRTYKNIPFYLSSRMYGLFLHTTAFAKFSLADHSTRSAQIMVEQPLIDVFLIGGSNPEEILYHYRQLTGFPSLPPLWSFGIWMSRMSYFSADEVNEICQRLRDEDYPCDVIHLDTGWFKTDWLCEWKFNDERFPDPKKFMAGLKAKGFRISLWQLPYVAYEAEQYKEAAKNNYIGPLKDKKGQEGSTSNFSALDYAGTIDFTNPKAVKWYQGLLKNLLEMGASCIKADFGEAIHIDADYQGMESKLLKNLYPLLYQKAAYEITRQVTGDGIIWARAGWAGCQRYPLHWGGDAACSWDGMAGSLKGGLHFGLSGFGFWSHDVPGFHGVPDFMNSVIPDDLYVRWTQFAVFTSHIRYHGTSKREPWNFPAISNIIRRWWKLRYCLIPYIFEQSEKTTKTGFPVLRALIFHHPNDPVCWYIDDEYYFGDDFLVAPVMNSENRRNVYLPGGKWVNFFDGSVSEGNQWLKNYEIPLNQMPVWVKYGAQIPVYPFAVSCTDDMDMGKIKFITFDDSYKGIYSSILNDIIFQTNKL